MRRTAYNKDRRKFLSLLHRKNYRQASKQKAQSLGLGRMTKP